MSIRQLPENIVNRIAAGEVIERPASVVKELVENAIDAGAKRIEVVISGGGRELIRVSDNGSGMTAEDLALSVERHATSKLDTEDLLNISTLGFRGEALPSIGAAARLSIVSRTRNSDSALEVRVEGGEKSAIRPAALSEGTRVEVRDLFYATPARLKFLKSEQAETAAAIDIVRRLALARPDVAFTVSANERLIQYPLRGIDEAGRAARLADVVGAEAQSNTISVRAEREGVRVEGLAGLPTYSKANSLSQYLFVNGRPVRDKVLMGALRGGYADLLHSGRYPVVALFIDLDPHEVDVNVHPAKAEVRFRDSSLVRGLVVRALQDALSGGSRRSATTGADRLAAFARPQASAFSSGQRTSASGRGGLAEAAQAAFDTILQPSADARGDAAPVLQADLARPLGAARTQLHETYIVAQTVDGLVIVDQHAAHERIVYEKLKRGLNEKVISTQILLVPAVVELDASDASVLVSRAEDLAKLGLVLEPFGQGAVLVRETPALLGETNAEDLVRDLAEYIAEWDNALPLERNLLAVASRVSCHGSIRAGRRLKPEEMNALLREMEQTENAGQCNHGRPTYVELKLFDIEKLFGRR